MDQQISNALVNASKNILKTGLALVATTVSGNYLKEQTSETMKSLSSAYIGVKHTIQAKKALNYK